MSYRNSRFKLNKIAQVMGVAIAMFVPLTQIMRAADQPPPPSAKSDPVPLTRDEMKRALAASKQSTPRLPLPPLTTEEQKLIEEQRRKAAETGEEPRRYGLANNGRMRAYYLPEYGFSLASDLERARAGTNRDAESSLDPAFRTMLFWIVSRGNNCTYCLGHQESGLAARGVTDDQLAALDGDWMEFDSAKQAAFAFATKVSFEPYLIEDADLAILRKHYSEQQIIELVVHIAGFNATNRWTGPLRIQQDVQFEFVRPTSLDFVSRVSRIAPGSTGNNGEAVVSPGPRGRPPLEPRSVVESALVTAQLRTPRLKLADESTARDLFKPEAGSSVSPQWVRLLATVPRTGAERIRSYQASLEAGTLDPRTRFIITYVGARHDRAWYALGHAVRRLRGLGFSDDQIFALDQPGELSSPADRELVTFARKITVDPALITDDDFSTMRALFGDKQVAEIVYQVTQAAFFDRLTETAGLQLEE